MRRIKRLLKKKKEAKEAKVKIVEYFKLASKGKRSNDYVRKARRLAMKYKLRIPKELKRRYCKHCYSYLIPGKNLRIRTQGKKVVYYCLNCKKFMRFPIKKKG